LLSKAKLECARAHLKLEFAAVLFDFVIIKRWNRWL